jgi:hypothetical protein
MDLKEQRLVIPDHCQKRYRNAVEWLLLLPRRLPEDVAGSWKRD